ncbi:MAG: HupE/UreJ family protein [Proteobacteria bacterium]|nr:HupE/UreJ family protein [Pseudomonadota bacterium]
MPESRAWIDTRADGVQLTLQIPLNRLEFAFGQPLADDPAQVLPRYADALARYVLLHVGARSVAAGWQALRPALRVTGSGSGGDAELEATVRLVAPPGADARQATLLLDAVTHEVRTHRIQVFLRNDWAAGVVAPQALGVLDATHTALPLALGEVQAGSALLAPFTLLREGALHIAEGTDHLLFLLTLLLVAPRVAEGRRWAGMRPMGAALRRVAWVVSAFTLGHSLTLGFGSTGLVRPPAQAVEVAVALTIAVAALHAWRPLFARAETWMALGFGLVHGFAFSASLDGAGLTFAQHAGALLFFNLGIELMQLLLVAIVMPPLLLVAVRRPRWFAATQSATALVALLAAAVWIAERLGAPWAELMPALPPTPVVAALLLPLPWLLAAAARLWSRGQPDAGCATTKRPS